MRISFRNPFVVVAHAISSVFNSIYRTISSLFQKAVPPQASVASAPLDPSRVTVVATSPSIGAMQADVNRLCSTVGPYALETDPERVIVAFAKDNCDSPDGCRKRQTIAARIDGVQIPVSEIRDGKLITGAALTGHAEWDARLTELTGESDPRCLLAVKELLTQMAFPPLFGPVMMYFLTKNIRHNFNYDHSYELIKNDKSIFVEVKCKIKILSPEEGIVEAAALCKVVQDTSGRWVVEQVSDEAVPESPGLSPAASS